jgi:hypothetical protein
MRAIPEILSKTSVKFIFLIVGILIVSCGGSSSTDQHITSRERGRQIVDEYLKRDSSPYRKSRIRFTVTEEGEAEKIYEIDNWRKQTADETTTLNEIVVAPQGEDGARTLTVEAKDKKTVVVTYAASRDEFRETDSKKLFFGGLSVGELLGDWDKFDFQFIGEKDLGGIRVLEVEGKLKSGADSIVSRMNVLFRSDNYVPAETHLFGADGREIRTYKTTAITDDPAHPYASRIEVDNSVYKTHIVIEVVYREFPASIDDSMFMREKLREPVRK